MKIRPAAVAGSFYPAEAAALRGAVDQLLAAATPSAGASGALKALIVPHAGYVYSGPIAASAYARLRDAAAGIRRVVLLGPAHRVALQGLALPDAQVFATPLGRVFVDAAGLAAVRHLPQIVVHPLAHAGEHSLEVQLPFLQCVLGEFQLVPLVVGAATVEQVVEVLDLLWGGPETLIVVSSDLSHYHPYAQARRLDQASAGTILELAPRLDHEAACGATPVNGLLLAARRHALVPALLDLRNSGDTAGDHRQVVGYPAFEFREALADGLH